MTWVFPYVSIVKPKKLQLQTQHLEYLLNTVTETLKTCQTQMPLLEGLQFQQADKMSHDKYIL